MSFMAGDFYKDLLGWVWTTHSIVLMRNCMFGGVQPLAHDHTAVVRLKLRSVSSGLVLFLLLPPASTCPVVIM